MISNVDNLKRRAVRLKRAKNCTHAAALDEVARQEGYANWSLLMKHQRDATRDAMLVDDGTLGASTVREIIELSQNRRRAFERIDRRHGIVPNEDGFLIPNAAWGRAFNEQINTGEALALERKVSDLSKAQRMELLALIWLGRGDFDESSDDWDSLVKQAYEASDAGDVGYICDKPLWMYLPVGLKKLGHALIEH